MPNFIHSPSRKNKVEISFGGQRGDGTFTLDPSQNPKHININISDKENMQGIYKITKDRLIISGVSANGDRPTDFSGEAPHVMLTLRRTTKKEQAKHREFNKKVAALLEQLQRALQEAAVARNRAELERARFQELKRRLELQTPNRLLCSLKNINLAKNTATVILKGTSLEIQSIAISDRCKFYMGREKCTINDLKSGMPATLSIQTKNDRTHITEIRATPQKKQ